MAQAAPAQRGAPRTFGQRLSTERPLTELAAITRQPARFEGEIVRTGGTIARVCQAMGCWMELRPEAGGPAVRVPMANHAFFLPRDVAGHPAVVEGRVRLAELDPSARAHLAGEGAEALGSPLFIEATGVEVSPAAVD